MTHQQRILKRSLKLKFLRDQFPQISPFWVEHFSFRDLHYDLFFHFYEGKLTQAFFQRKGPSDQILDSLLDVSLELVHNKTLKEISILSSREIENFLRDSNDVPVIEDHFLLQELDKLLEKVKNNVYNLAREKTSDITLDFKKVGFRKLKLVDQIIAVETILDKLVRPTLILDQGNIELLEIEDTKLVLSFQGACGTCPSSTAGTMDFVVKTLKSELNDDSLNIVLEK
jgi:Fe-S cluster biogenesis protein NfuA